MKPAPLKLVIERYRRLRDDAAAAQARVQMERETALRTLKTLEQYRDEQHERTRASQQQVLSTAHLLLRTRFSGKLEEAISLQKERIATIDEARAIQPREPRVEIDAGDDAAGWAV